MALALCRYFRNKVISNNWFDVRICVFSFIDSSMPDDHLTLLTRHNELCDGGLPKNDSFTRSLTHLSKEMSPVSQTRSSTRTMYRSLAVSILLQLADYLVEMYACPFHKLYTVHTSNGSFAQWFFDWFKLKLIGINSVWKEAWIRWR